MREESPYFEAKYIKNILVAAIGLEDQTISQINSHYFFEVSGKEYVLRLNKDPKDAILVFEKQEGSSHYSTIATEKTEQFKEAIQKYLYDSNIFKKPVSAFAAESWINRVKSKEVRDFLMDCLDEKDKGNIRGSLESVIHFELKHNASQKYGFDTLSCRMETDTPRRKEAEVFLSIKQSVEDGQIALHKIGEEPNE